MEIDHISGDHSDWRPENLAPICQFCHFALHPVQPGLDEHWPFISLLWLPEITQDAVSGLAWAILWLRVLSEDHRGGDDERRALAVDNVLNDTEDLCKQRSAAADEVTGGASPAAMLNVRVRAGKEPSAWRGLRWWPAAASPPGANDACGSLLRWRGGCGYQAAPARAVAARLSAQADFKTLKAAGEIMSAAVPAAREPSHPPNAGRMAAARARV